ncbi:hypothetical protein ABZ614_07945 [Streptomyces sp. NPDC013178]|uniref:hypothetical protein n=1 Tax=Streptomyces sp. NPDC013178 TaxID=3155118 RepID=UPI0033CBBF24
MTHAREPDRRRPAVHSDAIVASPCAVVPATMPPLLSAIANAGRHGVLVKSAQLLIVKVEQRYSLTSRPRNHRDPCSSPVGYAGNGSRTAFSSIAYLRASAGRRSANGAPGRLASP